MEEYDEYGDIKVSPERTLSFDQKHRIHQTKDLFESDCSLCQQDAAKNIRSYWHDDD